MDLSKFLKILAKNYKTLTFGSIVGLVTFLGLYFLLPNKHLAEGTIYIYPVNSSSQNSEVSNELNYARNIIALSNSPEFKNLIAEKSLVNSSFTPLIGITGNVKLKEVSPNILNLSVISEDRIEGSRVYNEYFHFLNEFATKLNRGNSSFEMILLSDSPIISSISNSLNLFLVLGFLCGLFSVGIYLYFKEAR
jgi:capsular polysaccharide biosynthesis protein